MTFRRAVVASLLLVIVIMFTPHGAGGSGDALREFLAREGSDWKIHKFGDGRIRSLYGTGTGRTIRESAEAKSFFADHAEMFRIRDVEHLQIKAVERDASGASYQFRQSVYGVPVLGGQFSLHTNKNHHLIAVSGQYINVDNLKGGTIQDRSFARTLATRFRKAEGAVSEGTLMILAGIKEPRYVWKFSVASKDSPEQWAVYVDAQSPGKIWRVHREFAEETGSGTVYRENVIATPTLTSEQFTNLKDASSLRGKFIRPYNGNFTLWFSTVVFDSFTTAAETDEDYTFPTTDSRFSEAMAYYHINLAHDRWRSFGFKKLERQFPVFVNVVTASGNGFDNAFYTRRSVPGHRPGTIVMGSGDFYGNFGQDADVYYHEYGHAVLDHAKPGFFEVVETNYPHAFHEGFSDISASGITGNATLAEYALRSRDSGRFFGRNLENNNRYPQNVILKGFGKSESHYTGLIIGGTWWDLQKRVGLDRAQRILYKSLAILPDEMTFFDLRDSMIAADQRDSGGANATAITNAFAEHGITGPDPGQKGSVSVLSLKTAKYNFSNGRLTLRSKFKPGDYVVVLAAYNGKGLTPGYNLIATDFSVTGPSGSFNAAYPWMDEVSNGLHLRNKGAWLVEIDTSQATPGEYTATVQARLGGTSILTDTKTVKFRITQ